MTTESTEQNNQNVGNATDFRAVYQLGIDDDSMSPAAKACAEKIMDRLTTVKPNSEAAAIMDQMQAAITRNDEDEIVKLAEQLKDLKLTKESQTEKLQSISEEFSFDDLLAAYPKEVEALAYELSVLAMGAAQAEIVKPKKSPRSSRGTTRVPSKAYVISHQGKTMDIVPNVGAPSIPGKERELFNFLGFHVSEDGRSLVPETFRTASGLDASAQSKKAIIEDLLAGGRYWVDKGYSIAERQTHAPATETQAA